MTISKTLKNLEALKEVILDDGKIDEQEVEVLLDFIDPYCKAGNHHFKMLNKMLKLSIADGKVSNEESEILVSEIEAVIRFLTIQKNIEKVLCITLGLGITFALVFNLIQHFCN